MTFAAGEIRDPSRTLPRALILGIVALVAICVSVNVAYFYALPIEQVRGTTRIGERAATALVGAWGATLVSVTVIVSTLGSNAAVLLAGPRLLFAMAEDGLFFHIAARIHPRFRTAHVAIVLVATWAALLALSGTYEQLFTYVAFGSILFSIASGLAVFRLRWRLPDHPRPYRTWGYPVVPALFVLGCRRAGRQHARRAAVAASGRPRPRRPRPAGVRILAARDVNPRTGLEARIAARCESGVRGSGGESAATGCHWREAVGPILNCSL